MLVADRVLLLLFFPFSVDLVPPAFSPARLGPSRPGLLAWRPIDRHGSAFHRPRFRDRVGHAHAHRTRVSRRQTKPQGQAPAAHGCVRSQGHQRLPGYLRIPHQSIHLSRALSNWKLAKLAQRTRRQRPGPQVQSSGAPLCPRRPLPPTAMGYLTCPHSGILPISSTPRSPRADERRATQLARRTGQPHAAVHKLPSDGLTEPLAACPDPTVVQAGSSATFNSSDQ